MTSPADADHGIDLDDLKRVLAEHKQRHARQEYPFCEDFGCMDVEPLVAELECLRRREAALREALLGLLGSTCIESTMREVVDAQDHAQAVLEQAGQPAQQVTVTAQASSWAGGWNPDALDDPAPVDDSAPAS